MLNDTTNLKNSLRVVKEVKNTAYHVIQPFHSQEFMQEERKHMSIQRLYMNIYSRFICKKSKAGNNLNASQWVKA